MSEPSVGSLINLSWCKTKEILLPFEFKRWLKILLIVWLAGQGAGGNFSLPNRPRSFPSQKQAQVQPVSPEASSAATTETISAQSLETAPSPTLTPQEKAKEAFKKLGPWLFVLIVIFIVLALLFMWLSARFQFIFLELVIRRDISIGESFRKFGAHGNSFFLWSWGFIGVFLAGSLLCFLPAILFRQAAWLFLSLPLFVIFLLAAAVLGVVVSDFVAPMMYQDGLKTMGALNKFFVLKPKTSDLFVYFLLKIGLGVLAGVLTFVIMLVVGLAILLVGLLALLLGVVLVKIFPFLKVSLLVLGVITGIVLFALSFGLATLFVPIFFRIFSLGFLARLIPEYNLLHIPLTDSGA